MRRLALAVLLASLAAPALAADAPKTEDQKTAYAIGLALGREVSIFALSPDEAKFVKEGLADQLAGKKPAVDYDAYSAKIQELAKTRSASRGKAFLETAAKEKGCVKTESGLLFVSLKEGTGPTPKETDTVKVHYRGTLVDGKEFDSSYKRGQPAEFPLNGVIKCWTEGVQKVKVGGKAKLTCPPAIAYGERGAGSSVPPNAVLVFEVELLDIVAKK